ncbi:MAG: nucleotide exchange factor GrpE, partial [Nitrospinota bacterium]
LLMTGCLVGEATHTFYLDPDGTLTWSVLEHGIRSNADDPAERRAEESLAGLVEELVGVLDDLNRALNSARSAPAAPAPGDGAAILEGVRLVTDRLAAILQARGLERVPGEGEAFDPNVHEALGMIPVEDPEKENQVVEEVLPGYLLKGRLLRPARVRVGRLKPPPSARSESAEATGERESS